MDPGLDPFKVRPVETEDSLDMAIDDRGGILVQLATDNDDVSADVRLRPEVHVAEYGNNRIVHLTIDVRAAHHGNDSIAHFAAGHPHIAKHRDNRIADVSRTT